MTIDKKFKVLLCLFAAIGIAVCSWEHFTYSEPPFDIIGDKDLLNKIQVNVYMFRYQENSLLKTVYLNGNSHKINNQNVDQFEIYVKYDNELFYHYGYDNAAKMINDENLAHNTLLFCKIGKSVFLSNRSTNCNDIKNKAQLISFDEELKNELYDASEIMNTNSDKNKENFIQDVKKSFFDVT